MPGPGPGRCHAQAGLAENPRFYTYLALFRPSGMRNGGKQRSHVAASMRPSQRVGVPSLVADGHQNDLPVGSAGRSL